MTGDILDILVIGGGVNGTGIARDAAGRGLKVGLVEMNDLGSATSSASTKLFHGGLRYLEHYEFALVRESLIERERLWGAMPHISWPMRFVLPHHKGLRPRWLLRLGLFMYDYIGGRKKLPPTKTLDLRRDVAGRALKDSFTKGFEYSDCWVEDSRLVLLNARDAEARGAKIMTRTKVLSAEEDGDIWTVKLSGKARTLKARVIVNAGGPWVEDIMTGALRRNTNEAVRLVRGSHIVTKRLFDHDKPYIFQGGDGRIVFAIPYEGDFTLIGTTDQDHDGADTKPECTPEEQDYLCAFVSDYLATPITRDDIVWTYSGVRPLYDDGASAAQGATRDCVLSLDPGGRLLNIFGGKITTHRRLSEEAVEKVEAVFPEMSGPWTAGVPMPGGDFPTDGVGDMVARLLEQYGFLDGAWALRMVRAYGTEVCAVLGHAKNPSDLGRHFGATLTEAEVRWMMAREYAECAEDVVWRRTKLGLKLSADEISALDEWMQEESRP